MNFLIDDDFMKDICHDGIQAGSMKIGGFCSMSMIGIGMMNNCF